MDTAVGQFRLQQRYALLTLWFQSTDPWDDTGGWLSDEDECEWHGVVCSSENLGSGIGQQNVVKKIDLDEGASGNNLQGKIPHDIALLTSLVEIDISCNEKITGTIPESIFDMTQLTRLDIGELEGLAGSLSPSIGSLTNLKVVHLHLNSLTGTLPDTIGLLTRLEM